jgi:hypothetical protein
LVGVEASSIGFTFEIPPIGNRLGQSIPGNVVAKECLQIVKLSGLEIFPYGK